MMLKIVNFLIAFGLGFIICSPFKFVLPTNILIICLVAIGGIALIATLIKLEIERKNSIRDKRIMHFIEHLEIRDIEFGDEYMIIKWGCKEVGFGECTFGIDCDDNKIIDDETMGVEFVRILCSKMADFYPLLDRSKLKPISEEDRKKLFEALKNGIKFDTDKS